MSVEIHHQPRLIFGKTNRRARSSGYKITCLTCEENGAKPEFPKRRIGKYTRKEALETKKAAYEHDVNEHCGEGKVELIVHVKKPKLYREIYVK